MPSDNGRPAEGTRKALGVLAMLGLVVFLGVIINKVPHADLVIVALIGLCLAGYDFWDQFFRG